MPSFLLCPSQGWSLLGLGFRTFRTLNLKSLVLGLGLMSPAESTMKFSGKGKARKMRLRIGPANAEMLQMKEACLSSESVSTAQSTTSSPSARLGFYVDTLNVGMTHLKAPELCHWESARVESAAEECCETFTGATTSAGQGIVDTAAQDGLVGNKPFILNTHSSPLA